MATEAGQPTDGYVYDFADGNAPQLSSRFRFKAHKRRRDNEDDVDDESMSTSRHHNHHHRSKRHHSRSVSPSSQSSSHRKHHRRRHHKYHDRKTTDDPETNPNTHASKRTETLDPEIAFRESLFDALADDEGAAFWEGVYGQAIHTYPRPQIPSQSDDPTNGEGANDENVNLMTDDEYATYVRGRMWEKTHEALLEERERRREAAARKKNEEARSRKEAEAFAASMDASLRRGEERRAKKGWNEAWEKYTKAWGLLTDKASHSEPRIPWPTRSGLLKDINPTSIETFFKNERTGDGIDNAMIEKSLRESLKKERIRWHPDRMQQIIDQAHARVDKARGDTGDHSDRRRLNAKTLEGVTGVFQVVDGMWAKLSTTG